MRLGTTLAVCATTWTLFEPSAWALPQCEGDPSSYSVRGWSESGDRVALHHEVSQSCTGGTRSSGLEVYDRGKTSPIACYDGYGSDPSTPVPCDEVTFIGDEAWGGADIPPSFIPLPEGFVSADHSLSARSAMVWATDGEDRTTYALEVFPPDPATPTTVPLGEILMLVDRWSSDPVPMAKPVSVSISVAPGGRWAVVLLGVTERDDDLEYVDEHWTMVELPEGVPLAAPDEPTQLEPKTIRCAPEDEEVRGRPVSRRILRALAKARVHRRLGNTMRALSILNDVTDGRPDLALGWATMLDVLLAEQATSRATSIAKRLRASCPALATEVLQDPRFDPLLARSTGKARPGR